MAVKSALKLLNSTVKHADEVVESAGRGTARSSMIKNAVNTVKSNRSAAQAKNIINAGGEAAANAARREGIGAAVNQVRANTTQRALANTVESTGSPVQHAKRIVDNKRVNQVIDGHNAQSRQAAMNTMVDNVRNNSMNRVPKDHQAARESIEKATETVRSKRAMLESEPKTNPLYEPKKTTYSYMNKNADGPNAKSGNFQAKEPSGGNTGSSSSRPKGNRQGEPSADNMNFEDFEGFDMGGFANQAYDFFTGGLRDSYDNIRSGQGVFEAIGNAHRNADGSVNMMRAAGSFMTASAAARVASGGGLYKDRYGNPNLIGVPFI